MITRCNHRCPDCEQRCIKTLGHTEEFPGTMSGLCYCPECLDWWLPDGGEVLAKPWLREANEKALDDARTLAINDVSILVAGDRVMSKATRVLGSVDRVLDNGNVIIITDSGETVYDNPGHVQRLARQVFTVADRKFLASLRIDWEAV